MHPLFELVNMNTQKVESYVLFQLWVIKQDTQYREHLKMKIIFKIYGVWIAKE